MSMRVKAIEINHEHRDSTVQVIVQNNQSFLLQYKYTAITTYELSIFYYVYGIDQVYSY